MMYIRLGYITLGTVLLYRGPKRPERFAVANGGR